MKKETIKELEDLKSKLISEMNEESEDFAEYVDLEYTTYYDDVISEYCDSAISVYYSDQFKYYEEDPSEAEDALLELYDSESIANIIKDRGLNELCCLAGVCYKERQIREEINEDEKSITQIIIINYLLKNSDKNIINENDIIDDIDILSDEIYEDFEELRDKVNELIEA